MMHLRRQPARAFLTTLVCLAYGGVALAQADAPSETAVELINPGFETDPVGQYTLSQPDRPVMGWRLFAGQNNSGQYEFAVVDDANQGDRALRITRQGEVGQGAGGGIDLTNAEIDPQAATALRVRFDAKADPTQEAGPGSSLLLAVMFQDRGERDKFEEVFELSDAYQTFDSGLIPIPSGSGGINVVFRPRNAEGQRGPSSVLLDDVRVGLVGLEPN
jgi:hypothetical protein